MGYLTKKRINGKEYTYLVKSIRLPDGRIGKIQKVVKQGGLSLVGAERQYSDYFAQKERDMNVNFSLGMYKADAIFTKEEIAKVESIKIEYRNLIRKLTKAQLNDAFDRFIANFTYESNAIEGSSLTLKDVNIVMFENLTIKDKPLREIYETRNSRKAMGLVLKRKFDMRHEDILKMHKMLMRDIDSQAGYKKVPNFLAGKRLKTTPPEKVYPEMTKLIDYYHDSKDIHPLMLSSIVHGRFEQIHPFEDGNGRVGRFLANMILINHKYPPLIIRKTSRVAYLNALEDYDYGYAGSLERFFLSRYKETFRKFFQVYAKYV